MSHWNYRVLQHDHGDDRYFAIHEVHYNTDGTVASWTADPAAMLGEDHEGLLWALKHMRRALRMSILVEIEGELMEPTREGGWKVPLHRRERGGRFQQLRELGEFLARWKARRP